MKSWHVVAVAVIVSALVLAGTTMMLHQDDGWSITYDTDGGSIPGDAPMSYREGDTFELPVPEFEGHVFTGWYLDTDPDQRVVTVEGLAGDLVLHAAWIEAVEHSIGYVLNGGELPDGSVSSFVGGIGTVLPIPERGGYVFGGWFEDPELTVPVVVIGTDVLTDMTVYACWETVMAGTGYLWEVRGVYYNGDIRHTVEGTVREEFIADRDGAFYVQTTNGLKYEWPTGSTYDGSTRGHWTDSGSGGSLSYMGIEEVNGYVCTVWGSEDGTRYWLYHLTVQVRAVVQVGGSDIVHDLVEVYSFVPDDSFLPDVTAEYPLDVKGVRTMTIGDTLELTAVGEGFVGWYSGDKLLTTDRTLRVWRADPTGEYEARTADDYLVVDTGWTPENAGFDRDCGITDWDGEPVAWSSGGLEPGYYIVSDRSDTVKRYLELFIDETSTFQLQWEYGGTLYNVGLDISLSDVFRYKYEDPYDNIRISMTDQGYVANFHTTDDPYLARVLDVLAVYGEGMNRTEFAQFVLSFVQNVTYLDDQSSTGRAEYWKYPLETLWDGGGDCEDKAILYGTLMLMAGYDTAFVLFQDHAMSAVAVDSEGHSLSDGGIRYVFCETTNRWTIGQTSVGHTEDDVYYWCPVVPETSTDIDKNP